MVISRSWYSRNCDRHLGEAGAQSNTGHVAEHAQSRRGLLAGCSFFSSDPKMPQCGIWCGMIMRKTCPDMAWQEVTWFDMVRHDLTDMLNHDIVLDVITSQVVSRAMTCCEYLHGRTNKAWLGAVWHGVIPTFGVARLTLQTPELSMVGVATDRDARHACLRFFSFYLFLFFFLLAFLSIFNFYLFFFAIFFANTKNLKKRNGNQKWNFF